MLNHDIAPVYDRNSRILILGSFPSVRSREIGFFYGHPQNRFWRICGALFEEEVPETIPARKAFLLRNGIALWDVIASCDIIGSSDLSIRNVTVNDIGIILNEADIRQIFVNGSTAGKYYRRYLEEMTGRSAYVLPSSSPANARYSLKDLINEWKVIKTVI